MAEADLTQPVLCTREGAIAYLTLNRPSALNSLDLPMACALRAAAAGIAADPGVRAVVLSGNGSHFMAGGDVRRFDALLQDSVPACRDELTRIIDAAHDTIRLLDRLDAPVIAAVAGSAAGFGLSLALACDLVIAAENARFVFAYGALGATPDGGASWALPRLLGLQRAMGIALLNPVIDARRALALGLVSDVVPDAALPAATRTLAEHIAEGSPGANAGIKRLLRDGLGRSLDASLDAERASFLARAGHPDFAEGVAAFCAHRTPHFAPP